MLPTGERRGIARGTAARSARGPRGIASQVFPWPGGHLCPVTFAGPAAHLWPATWPGLPVRGRRIVPDVAGRDAVREKLNGTPDHSVGTANEYFRIFAARIFSDRLGQHSRDAVEIWLARYD